MGYDLKRCLDVVVEGIGKILEIYERMLELGNTCFATVLHEIKMSGRGTADAWNLPEKGQDDLDGKYFGDKDGENDEEGNSNGRTEY